MFAWVSRLLCYFIRGEGRDWHGRLRILAGRESDPSLCNVKGISPVVAGEAIDMICEAFMIPESQQFCLRPDDVLMDIYRSMYRYTVVDAMEFEHLTISLEKACHRKFSKHEMSSIRTVEDVIRFLGGGQPLFPEDRGDDSIR